MVKIAHPRKTRILGLIGFGDMEMTVTLLSDGTVFTRLSLAHLGRPGVEISALKRRLQAYLNSRTREVRRFPFALTSTFRSILYCIVANIGVIRKRPDGGELKEEASVSASLFRRLCGRWLLVQCSHQTPAVSSRCGSRQISFSASLYV